jgi:ATP-dependent Clp protease ATP-binding subunit ClpC
MFERYTEKARRVIFFARYEASQLGSPYIETEHLLLGLARDEAMKNRLQRANASSEWIRKQVEGHTTIGEKFSTSVDLPLSNECKRVLAYAAEEAERLSHKHIGTEHLLLGLMREEKSFAAEILRERGLRLAAIRKELADSPQISTSHRPAESSSAGEWFRDLTQAAAAGEHHPIVGRDLELDSVIEILCCCHKNNVLLLGARGAGKTAIVEGLAQRIAQGKAPLCLGDKKIIALKTDALRSGPGGRQRLEEIVAMASGGGNAAGTIVFFDEVQSYSDEANILKRVLLRAGVQCIGVMDSGGVSEQSHARSWSHEFRTVHVRPLDDASTLAVLATRKGTLEVFHGVTYTQEALQFAVDAAPGYLLEYALPGKAVDILDAAGARVKLRQPEPPREIAEVEVRLRSLIDRMETAIANHEFEKARYYSDEHQRERKGLQELKKKHKLSDTAPVVGPDDLKEVVARWTAYPYSL